MTEPPMAKCSQLISQEINNEKLTNEEGNGGMKD